jgi:hypothetical protein
VYRNSPEQPAWVAFHHPRNTPAIAMNRRLGFADLVAGD